MQTGHREVLRKAYTDKAYAGFFLQAVAYASIGDTLAALDPNITDQHLKYVAYARSS